MYYVLRTPHCTTQKFYFLIKTHKKDFKIRPIVSNIGGPFERIGWLLQRILQPLTKHVAAHLESTSSFLDKLEMANLNPCNNQILSFDVISLYTNVPISEAIEVACDYTTEYKPETFNLTVVHIKKFLNIILHNNVFSFDDKVFKQKEGLAMGSKIAPVLAILVMDKLERKTVHDSTFFSTNIYLRYVDDTFITIQKDANPISLLEKLNSTHPSIKFEIELPDQTTGFLPFLDTQVALDQTKKFRFKLYTKTANKNLFVNQKSAVPQSTKLNSAIAEYSRALKNSSNNNLIEESSSQITDKLLNNGYSQEFALKCKNRALHPKERRKIVNNFTIGLPFITDNFNKRIRPSLQRSSLKIIQSTPEAVRSPIFLIKSIERKGNVRNESASSVTARQTRASSIM